MPKLARKKIFFSKIRLHLWRWHRRMGLLSALFVLLLAVTGILLNHGNRLGLDAKFLPSGWLAFFYDIDTPATVSFAIDDYVVSQLGGRQLFIDESAVGNCVGDLLGAVPVDGLILVACRQQLLLLTGDGAVVDQLGAISGVPLPVAEVGQCDSGVCWRSQNQIYNLDIDTMQWQTAIETLQSQSSQTPTPPALRAALTRNYAGGISWERWLQDLHSGRLLGAWGPWLMDAMALLFIALATTGVVMWTLGRRKRS